MFKNLKLQTKSLILSVGTVSIILIVISIVSYYISASILQKEIKTELTSIANSTANEANTFFTRISQVPATVSSLDIALLDLSDHSNLLLSEMQPILNNDPDILNVYTAYEKGAVDNRDYLILGFMFDANRQNISQIALNLPGSENYDPSQPIYEYHTDDAWYALAKRVGHTVWGPPYYDEGGMNQLIVSTVTPTYVDGKFIGVAGSDVTLAHLNEIIENIKLGKTGYGFVVTSDMKVIAHPLFPDAAKNGLSLSEISGDGNKATIDAISADIQSGNSGIVELDNAQTGLNSNHGLVADSGSPTR